MNSRWIPDLPTSVSRRTSENTHSRNCLINRQKGLDRGSLAAKTPGYKGTPLPCLPALGAPEPSLFRFFGQFRKGLSRKFAARKQRPSEANHPKNSPFGGCGQDLRPLYCPTVGVGECPKRGRRGVHGVRRTESLLKWAP